MVEAIFDFFQVHRKMVFGHAPIMIQNMFRVTPKAFNPINMVFDPATTDEGFGMIDRMMFPVPFQGLITPKGVCVIDRPFPGLGLDMSHESSALTDSTTLV